MPRYGQIVDQRKCPPDVSYVLQTKEATYLSMSPNVEYHGILPVDPKCPRRIKVLPLTQYSAKLSARGPQLHVNVEQTEKNAACILRAVRRVGSVRRWEVPNRQNVEEEMGARRLRR